MSGKAVKTRRLGKDGPTVPALGFGLMGLSVAYGAAPEDEERFKLLDRALELGETFWDTANIYGDSEELLGRWFERTGKRDEIFLASKFGIVLEGFQFKGVNSTAAYCKKCCEESLKRMKVDCIDLYYAHRLNPDTPIEETMRGMVELQKEGKIKYIGLSEASSDTIRRAVKIAPVSAVQMEYSPFVLDIERASGTNAFQTCQELGVAIVCYSPLGRGLLTGTSNFKELLNDEKDVRSTHIPWFSEENIDANIKLGDQFKALADKKGCTASQLAIAWILRQGDNMIPIPGTRKIKYLEQNWSSLEVHLTDREEAEIREFVEAAETAGHRTMPAGRAMAYVKTKEQS